MRVSLFPCLAISLAACTTHPQPITGPAGQALVVHEWGTYTSVQSSEGKTLEGLHHAEELLPSFVHARDLGNPDHKGMPLAPRGVTQKLETPVLYFYGAPQRVDVRVRFPVGLISEWYPSASDFGPAVGAETNLADGSMRWTLDLVPASQIKPPSVPEESVWAPSRRVNAMGVRLGREEEHFIFYRGLGQFERPVRASASAGALVLENASNDALPRAFLLAVNAEGGAFVELGHVGANERKSVMLPTSFDPLDAYVERAKGGLREALEASGLFADEARAMVDTWTRSYFETPGTRILYIAPRAWTDALLPIAIVPTPQALVRTLVGRIEVLLPEEEAAVALDLEAAAHGGPPVAFDQYGRFTEPKLRRALELIDDPETRAYAEGLVSQAAEMP